jgi:4-carboxymuconolactone decarboxylase
MTELQPDGGWISHSSARLTAPPMAERGLLFRLLGRLSRRLGRQEVPDVITVLHLNPRLFWAWLFFASRLMPYGRLPAKVREKIILRTGWNCRSRYEWGQHVDIGLSVGVTDEEIVKVSQGPAVFAGHDDQALMLACDEMCAEQCISDSTWKTLSERYDKKRLIEIMMLIGHYIMIAGFLNSAGLRLEKPIEDKLQAFHARVFRK